MASSSGSGRAARVRSAPPSPLGLPRGSGISGTANIRRAAGKCRPVCAANLPFARRGKRCYNGRRLFREVRPWTRRDYRRRCSRCSAGTAGTRACCPGAPTASRTTCGSRRSCCSRRASRPCAGTTRAFSRPRRTCSRSRRCRRRSCSSSGRGWGTITARARRRPARRRSRRRLARHGRGSAGAAGHRSVYRRGDRLDLL